MSISSLHWMELPVCQTVSNTLLLHAQIYPLEKFSGYVHVLIKCSLPFCTECCQSVSIIILHWMLSDCPLPLCTECCQTPLYLPFCTRHRLYVHYLSSLNTYSMSFTYYIESLFCVHYLSALNADSVSMYRTFPSRPPLFPGRVASTLSMVQNWVLPHPEGPAIYFL